MRLPVFLSALTLLVASTAHAATTTIDFQGLKGSNGEVFTGYTESGFTVSPLLGVFFKSIGPAPFIGNPSPDIYSFGISSILVTDGGKAFDFSSVDIGASAHEKVSYIVSGYSGFTNVFTQAGSVSLGDQSFATIGSLYGLTSITSLQIYLSLTRGFGGENIDNIVLGSPSAVTPEPSSLVLLGTGLLGLAGMAKRRFV